jgi:hypothetical protein
MYVKLEFRRRLHILYGSDGYLLYISRRKYRYLWYASLSFSYILYLDSYINGSYY